MHLLNKWRLKSGDPQVRRLAVERLAESNSLQAVEALVSCLCDKDAIVRRTAARAFSEITDGRSVTALVTALNDSNYEVRGAAALALGRQGDLSSIKALIHCLRDPKSRVRNAAALSLRKLGWKPRDKEDHALFEIALGNPRGAVRAGSDAVAPLASELSCDTSLCRRAVAEVLRDLNDPRATNSLLKAATFDPDVSVRVAAIYGLADMEASLAVPVLEKGISAGDERVRLAAVQVLAKKAGPKQVPRFLLLLKDNHFEVRLASINFLGKLRDAKFNEALVPMLWDHDHDVREAAAKVLGEMKCQTAKEALILALIDEEHAVRIAAERALEQIDQQWISSEAAQKAKARLELSANDGRSWVRSATVDLLDKLRPPAEPAAVAA
ncbi:MAG TPA: HEAT repeat domain-containing protein [Verrucomicrobiae bacterium]|nr:HEAT repeat domain-containing protein [Verrucomicrobiae bacterium]